MMNDEFTKEMDKAEAEDKAKSDAAFTAIREKLLTFDGVAMGDAMDLAILVKSYGDARAHEASGAIMKPLMKSLLGTKPPPPPMVEPWRGGL